MMCLALTYTLPLVGDGNVSRKFELVYEDEDEYDGGDSSKQVEEQSTKVWILK